MVHPKLRVIFFLVSLNLLGFFLAGLVLDRAAWLWVVALALSINTLWWTYDHVLVFWRLVGEPLGGQDAWGLLKIVHALSARLEVRAPAVYFVDGPQAQIFCYARTRRSARVFVTRGALEVLSARELEAALTYQMCVLRSSYGLLNYWLGAWIDLSWRLGLGAQKVLAFIFGWSPPVATWVVAPWTWLLQHLLLSARDFARLDRETGARLAHPEDLARALWKMHAYAQTQPWPDAWVFSPMCMVSPLAPGPMLGLKVQPPIERRIERLAGHFPL